MVIMLMVILNINQIVTEYVQKNFIMENINRRIKTMIKLERNRNLKREVWNIIAIKGKISKILNKYEIEVYFAEENGIKTN